MRHPHRWEAAVDEAYDHLSHLEQEAMDDLMGDRVPFSPEAKRDEQMAFFLEHLYPNGQAEPDPNYVAQLVATSSPEQIKELQHALDRYVEQKAQGTDEEKPYPHLAYANALPTPDRR